MAEVADYKVAECMPRTFQTMLNVLCTENGLRSYQIYNDKFGVSVRIRFDCDRSGAGIACMSRQQLNSTTKHTTNTSYVKRPPSHNRRETERKLLRAKRQRRDIEEERNSDLDESHIRILESPLKVCCERGEENIFVAPVTPLKMDMLKAENSCKMSYDEHLRSSPKVIEEEVADSVLKCPCCNEQMCDAFHTCKLHSSFDTITDEEILDNSSETCKNGDAEMEEYNDGCDVVKNVPKLTKVYDKKKIPYYTYCSIAHEHSDRPHSNLEYYLCKCCLSFVCFTCFYKYFMWNTPNSPICCANEDIPDIPYDKELKPK